jgi:hypothetical protein
MWQHVPTVTDPAALADPSIWPDDAEFEEFLAFTRSERRTHLAQ